jgi:hypothetical protein
MVKNKWSMKRIFALTALIIILLAFFVACGSSRNCPAYSKASTEQSAEQNS